MSKNDSTPSSTEHEANASVGPTLGPWKLAEQRSRHGHIYDVYGADDYSVAHINGRNPDEREANALLIAAAPEMLDALKEVLPVLGAVRRMMEPVASANNFGGTSGPLLDQVNAAIAKAEGRTPPKAA